MELKEVVCSFFSLNFFEQSFLSGQNRYILDKAGSENFYGLFHTPEYLANNLNLNTHMSPGRCLSIDVDGLCLCGHGKYYSLSNMWMLIVILSPYPILISFNTLFPGVRKGTVDRG